MQLRPHSCSSWFVASRYQCVFPILQTLANRLTIPSMPVVLEEFHHANVHPSQAHVCYSRRRHFYSICSAQKPTVASLAVSLSSYWAHHYHSHWISAGLAMRVAPIHRFLQDSSVVVAVVHHLPVAVCPVQQQDPLYEIRCHHVPASIHHPNSPVYPGRYVEVAH